jgi:acid phosphatase
VSSFAAEVPANCYVDQAAYVIRHGSRYPDPGAYSGWVDMQSRVGSLQSKIATSQLTREQFSVDDYTATGSLAFMKQWRTVLTNPTLQTSMESATGAKEAHDLGYQLRTR